MSESGEVTAVEPGSRVKVVDENYVEHNALVTCVHGQFGTDNGYVPCINVVYVTGDPAKRDPYGAQLERMSSLQHLTQGPAGMPTPGRYWVNA